MSRSSKLQRSLTASNQRALEELDEDHLCQVLQTFRTEELEKVQQTNVRQAALQTQGTLGPTSLQPTTQKHIIKKLEGTVKTKGAANGSNSNNIGINDFQMPNQ